MPTFVAIKIHYDHRSELPRHAKYSLVPSLEEYNDYLDLYNEDDIGGNGFHECINFATAQTDTVKFYLPPTCMPGEERRNNHDEFMFFSCTYGGDQDLPAHIVGIHAGARLVTPPDGVTRDPPFVIDGLNPQLKFHAESPADLVTLIPPLEYDVRAGIYMPFYEVWGNGRRYIEEEHAGNIVRDAFNKALVTLKEAVGDSEKAAIERQIDVLRRINARYNLDAINADNPGEQGVAGGIGMTNIEIGYRGEQFVYRRELAYVKSIGKDRSEVQWTSQVVPTSPFDIRTLRRMPDGTVREHFLDVKSSAMTEGENVYISSMQLKFFENKQNNATFALVNFSAGNNPSIRELTLGELRAEFDLHPVKYKLARRT